MKMALVLPVMDQLWHTKASYALFKEHTSVDTEWIIVDNSTQDPVEKFIFDCIKPDKINYIKNEENAGLIPSLNQAFQASDADVIAFSHNDVYIFEKDWDKKILKYFETIPKLGVVGFFGAGGCGPDGQRIQDVPSEKYLAGVSNILEAEYHGFRMTEPYKACAIIDGFMMIIKRELLVKTGGFDTRYLYHHIYDRDISLESLRHGYRNIVAGIYCHHQSGVTANSGEYQNWVANKTKDVRGEEQGDKFTHDENTRRFMNKWEGTLPLYVEENFAFRSADVQYVWGNFKGDAIVGHKEKI